MSLENHKITVYQDNVKDLPDYPSDGGYTAQRLKEIFDGRTDKEIKEKFNALIDGLVAKFIEVDAEVEAGDESAKGYADGAVSAHNGAGEAHADIRTSIEDLARRLNAIADSDDVTLDQLSEIVNYIKDNRSVIDSIMQDKANKSDVYTKTETDVRIAVAVDGCVKPTDYASASKAGVVKVDGSLGASGLWIKNGNLTIFEAMDVDIESRQPMAVITASNFDYAMKFFGDGYYATAEEVGDISSALDELHAYAEALIGGAE